MIAGYHNLMSYELPVGSYQNSEDRPTFFNLPRSLPEPSPMIAGFGYSAFSILRPSAGFAALRWSCHGARWSRRERHTTPVEHHILCKARTPRVATWDGSPSADLYDKSAQAFACVCEVWRKNISLADLLKTLMRV